MLLSALVFVVSVGGYAVYRYFDGQIARIRLDLDGERPAAHADGAKNFLLVGSDSRAGTGGEFQHDGVVDGERSDTTILAHLDPEGTTTLVSFPRDTLVRIPGHGRGKLNSAITIGGPSLLIRTIEGMTGLRVDHYVSIDLEGFRQMTDAIGGVTVCLRALPDGSTSNLHDPWSQWSGVVGENHLDGDAALAFVRQRHGLPEGDFDRILRQQQFLGALFTKATSSGVLANPVRMEELLHAVTGALTVDDGTTIDDLQRLATRLRGVSADQIRFLTIPVRPPTPAEGANELGELPGFGSVQLYDPRELAEFLAPLRGESPRAQSGGPTTAPPPASSPRVDVYNGAGVSGLAKEATADLVAAGFPVGPARTWSAGVIDRTEIRHRPGREDDAAALAAVTPGARLVADRSVPTGSVTLVLGADYTGFALPTDQSGNTGAATNGGTGGGGTTQAGGGRPGSAGERTAADLTSSCTY
ncbi:MAG: LCP family protein [Frankia sp.]|nr:LCP family protein [Frankia sp.]